MSLSRVHTYSKKSITPNSIKLPVWVASSSYYLTQLTLGAGHGLITTYVLIDTAYPETWIQCEGCDPCIQLANRNFPYSESPSFRKMRKQDRMCDPYWEYDGFCGFDFVYGLNARARGFIGKDRFYFFMDNSDQTFMVPSVAFGCALENENFNFGSNDGPHNIIAGIHGLAPGPRSFLTQLGYQIRNRFSYCLVSFHYYINAAHSFMHFGDYAQISGDDDRIVQTISMYNERHYHLYLNGISVDGVRLSIDPSIFELDPEHFRRGFFIDSGTPITTLARSAYKPLEDAVAEFFRDNYGMHPIDVSNDEKDLCYLNDLDHIPNLPSVILHFELHGHNEDVDWVLGKDNVFRTFSTEGGFCLAIIDTDDPGPNVFGSYQQADFHILYDVENGLLSFVPERCQEITA
ncbi:hypothetical protein RND81_09G213300 [Saponaria officinalis]|uniref:Peptidase A1 domain-containing protein n=1 Tax=Saponaria officinalis TaxID=3572 RepID=A0AAW1IPS1_SAPOF